MDPKTIVQLALKAAGELKRDLQQVSGGVTVAGLQSLWAHVPAVVEKVELLAAEIGPELKGADKMSLAVETLCELVDVWWLPDWVIRKIAPPILEGALKVIKARL